MLIAMVDKKAILNLRLDPETREQFAVAAKLRGASMSGLIHQFIVRTIREERMAFPEEFQQRQAAVSKVAATIEPSEETKVRRKIREDLQSGPLPAARLKVQKEHAAPVHHKKKTGT